jgi:cyclopropane fatty-acyl-phospholipid synthase-like methyltransferase
MSTTDASFFDQKYAQSCDPWSFACDAYELARYELILAHVDVGRFHSVLEPGCSIGVLTASLSNRCGHVRATDISAVAIAHARARCAGLANVELAVERLSADIPRDSYDLIVFSEVGYYFSVEELDAVIESLANALTSGGRIIAAHWLGESSDHLLQGGEVHERLRCRLPFVRGEQLIVTDSERAGFVLDVWNHRGDAA